jgi:hypothetical protein
MKSTASVRVGAITLAAIACVTSLSCPAAYSQQPQQQKTTARFVPLKLEPGAKSSTLPAKNTPFRYGDKMISDTTYEHLRTAPIELPGMTQISPPASQFVYAMKKQSDKHVTTLNMLYHCAERPDAVVRYYSEVFRQPGWRILSTNERQVDALYGLNNCSITVTPAANRQFPSDVSVIYRLKL